MRLTANRAHHWNCLSIPGRLVYDSLFLIAVFRLGLGTTAMAFVRAWGQSDDADRIHFQLLECLETSTSLELPGLALATLLCLQRLRSPADAKSSHSSVTLDHLELLFTDSCPIDEMRATLEHTAWSYVRALSHIYKGNPQHIHHLMTDLITDDDPSDDRVTDHYWIERLSFRWSHEDVMNHVLHRGIANQGVDIHDSPRHPHESECISLLWLDHSDNYQYP